MKILTATPAYISATVSPSASHCSKGNKIDLDKPRLADGVPESNSTSQVKSSETYQCPCLWQKGS
ncbi:hypothetical protein P691DRAFT_808878 [Macrolepiota fuliginosa MF-IS2]|uniref:Uncharacterized protein n=1 Tax=Macrolepiota fuliginosa MF-IS2 TaxID=1400762 RepID=A0A9P5XHX0_9AGAR|nr:hypothetical protein P691DRAFT_808878 [Macrolepiota fuliginosa MF-IS2]